MLGTTNHQPVATQPSSVASTVVVSAWSSEYRYGPMLSTQTIATATIATTPAAYDPVNEYTCPRENTPTADPMAKRK